MNRPVLLLLLFCLAVTPLFAQSTSGDVVDAFTGKGLYPVAVVNLITQETVYTNANGHFSITAKTGEQLAFTYAGYTTTLRKVPAALGIVPWRIEMSPLNYQMNEVLVRPKYTQYQFDSVERRSTYARPLAWHKKGSVMSPVSLLAEAFSKRTHQLERFQKDFKYLENERYIDTRYTPELVQSLTHLSGDTLAYFMNAYPMPYDYARAATDLEVKMWIRTNYKEWLRRGQVDSLPSAPPVAKP